MYILHLNHATDDRVALVDRSKMSCFGGKINEIIYVDRDDIEYAKAIVDPESEECRYLEVIVPGYAQAFQWIHLDYKKSYEEYLTNNNLKNIAFGSVEFKDIDSEDVILEYLKDVGEGYYDNLPIPD
jgi:hypothetical protein